MAAPTLPASARPGAAVVNPASRERACVIALRWIGALVALGLAGHLFVLLWAQHDFTPVEALVVLHANMFAHGQGLYWGVNRYPYTISAYGPIFYAVSGFLHKWGAPAYQSGRILSFAALLTSLWLCWQALGYLTRNAFARATAVILAASTANILYWGSTGQVDMLACCFSLAAFTLFLKFRQQRDDRALALAGVFVILAIFTKQTFLAAGTAIGITLLWEDRRRALLWIGSVALAGGAIALALNTATHGGFFADAIFANINPFALVQAGAARTISAPHRRRRDRNRAGRSRESLAARRASLYLRGPRGLCLAPDGAEDRFRSQLSDGDDACAVRLRRLRARSSGLLP